MLEILLSLLLAQQPAPPAPIRPAPCSTPEHRALDFWVGEWDLSFDAGGGKTGRATNSITNNEFGACVVTEAFQQPDIQFFGASLSSYDPIGKRWLQTWVDNGGGHIMLAGGPVENQPWRFELKTLEPRGPARKHYRMIWQDVTRDSLVWRWQQLQEDGSYVDAWVLNYQRRK
jgi:hypothetical protein